MEEKIIEYLSPIERKVLPNISENLSIEEISKKSGADNTTVLRAIDFLKNKNLVEVETKEKKVISLGINGVYYKKKGLPERKILDSLVEKKSIPLSEIKNVCEINESEVKASIGTLKKKCLLDIKEGKVILTASEQEAKKETFEEKLLKTLPRDLDDLQPEELFALELLKNRKEIVEINLAKSVNLKLTNLGKKIAQQDLSEELLEQVTSKIILSEGWKGKKFRKYDLQSQVPRLYGGKRHFVNQSVDYSKKIWLELGFKEMVGPMADSSFWIFDALFTPQDHQAREMQDTFFIKSIKAKLPDKKLVESVKKSHEVGVSGSKGWKYYWSSEISKKVVLRTHTTGISARTLASLKKEDLPAKYFILGKVFRNETVDWKHAIEFYQTEGIVIDENANFGHLLGYLKEFYKKMGFEKIKFVPSFFAYTEPSVEIQAWHPERKEWFELGGAGVFRPEVTEPLLGKPIPVLAWGQGFDRIIMDAYAIKDLRELYQNNIKQLREKPFWNK